MSRFTGELRTGLYYGGFAGVAYSVYVVGAALVTQGRLLEQFDLSLLSVVGLYLGGGLAGGLAYGFLAPLTRWRLGAGLVGFLVTMPAFIGVSYLVPDAGSTPTDDWIAVVISAAVVGGLGGMLLWEPRVRDP